MKIVISTGIYPPEIGGPAEYAKNLHDALALQGHGVHVRVFGKFRRFPWGIRHIVFFLYVLPTVASSDFVIALDGFSAGVMVLAAKLFGKKVVFRTGGDLLWEAFVDRTKEPVLLKDFYRTSLQKLSLKEKMMFRLMRWTLRNLSAIVWSTEWQRDIFLKPYGLETQRHFIVENFYPPVSRRGEIEMPAKKVFFSPSRDIFLKNKTMLAQVFAEISKTNPEVVLDMKTVLHGAISQKLASVYALIVPSLSEISPNLALEALGTCTPIIVTEENGIRDRLHDMAVFINPLQQSSMTEGIQKLLNPDAYADYKRKLGERTFVHSWQQIADEFTGIYRKL